MKAKTKICFGIRGKHQTPLFLIWKEYWNELGKIEYAEVLFSIGK